MRSAPDGGVTRHASSVWATIRVGTEIRSRARLVTASPCRYRTVMLDVSTSPAIFSRLWIAA